MDLRVERLEAVSDGDAAAISGLVAQMSSSGAAVPIERISRVATAPGSCILVARTADAVVGTATLLSIDTLVGQFGFVEEVVVDASMRGRGIGRRLMMGVLAAARERGHNFVELTSRPSREAANGLYRSLGFRLRETNVYRFELREERRR